LEEFAVKSGTMFQTAVRLDREMHDRLKAGERGLSDEIRWRVQRTLDEDDTYDAPTRELGAAVMALALEVQRETGCSWHNHAGAHRLLRRAILTKLARLKPEGPMFDGQPGRTIPGTDLEDIGMWIEHDVWTQRDWTPEGREHFRKMKEQTLGEIRERVSKQQNEGEDEQ
jgi:hypothetical protein